LLIFRRLFGKSSHKPKALEVIFIEVLTLQKTRLLLLLKVPIGLGMRADILIGILIINLCELFLPNPFDALLLQRF
jgi:hypothetical protein